MKTPLSRPAKGMILGGILLVSGILCAAIVIGYRTGINVDEQAGLRAINSVCKEMLTSSGRAPNDATALIGYWESKRHNPRFLDRVKTGKVRYYRLSDHTWLLVNTAKPIGVLAIERRIDNGTPTLLYVWQGGKTSSWTEE